MCQENREHLNGNKYDFLPDETIWMLQILK